MMLNSPLWKILLWCDFDDDDEHEGIGALGANSCGASSIKLVVQILSLVAKVPTEWRRWWPLDLVSEFWDKLKNLWSLWGLKFNCSICDVINYSTLILCRKRRPFHHFEIPHAIQVENEHLLCSLAVHSYVSDFDFYYPILLNEVIEEK